MRAAIIKDNKVYAARTHAKAQKLCERRTGTYPEHPWDEGFLTSSCKFVDRFRAGEIALKAKQISYPDFEFISKELGLASEELGWR